MATCKEDIDSKVTTVCGDCKEKLKSVWQEWVNNFKICYCPWKSNTYDIDSDPGEQQPLLHQKKDQVVEMVDTPTNDKEREKQGSPTQETSSQVTPTHEPPTQEIPSQTVPTQETPKQMTPTQETPKQMTPTLEQLEDLGIEPTVYNTLGFYLQIGQESLNEIGRNTTLTKDCLREMYRTWLERGVNVSWESLAQALESMQLTDKAKEIRREHVTSTTPKQMTPTLEQLEDLSIEPTVYNTLGFYLQIGLESLNEIGRNTTLTKDCLREMYRAWLKRGVDVSWESLAQALESMQLTDKAEEIRREHVRNSS